MRLAIAIGLLLSVALFAAGCAAKERQVRAIDPLAKRPGIPDPNSIRLGTIGMPSTTDEQVIEQIACLMPGVDETPFFWSRIANNAAFRPKHRALCVRQLFARHVHPPLTFAALRRLLDKPTWLAPDDIERANGIFGFMPIRRLFLHPDEDKPIMEISLPGEDRRIYFLIDKEMTAKEFYDALNDSNSKFSKVLILDIGW
jgi:hypothetical protein